ncbi:amino acid permease 3-like [Dorcoceras hygrometricum]|uniref:Amino acid permease 3-like n=1 Tax=Dorcoceras hygrometricum TaxID=472368 RepID=A0A2Z7B9I0_9LAMI|nr:amino acid permease 3-like [Dorcoceras hygrometricum]
MVVDLIGIYGLKGPYCMLTTTKWFLQALSVIPRGSWGDVARRSYQMSLFDLQDVCIAIGSIATLDLPMVVDLIGIYGLKGPYCMLTTTKWFLQALSVIPRGSWGDVARRSYHDQLGKSGIVILEPQWLWAQG